MTIDEILENYSGNEKFRRKNDPSWFTPHDLESIRDIKTWWNEDTRKLGFIIFSSMIESGKADDWEVCE